MPANPMRFIEGPPTFAAEVRSENDYSRRAEAEMADKRADYFAAGTKVVWDVDPQAECVHVYKASDPSQPTTYHRGQVAEAEPAVPGWRVAVDSIFS
jgi:Uma2 family endonuclease